MTAQRIESLDDPRVADYRNIRDAELLRERGLFMAEGILVVATLLSQTRFRARSVFTTPAAHRSLLKKMGELPSEIPVYVAEQEVFSGVAGFHLHRGCLAAGDRGLPLEAATLLPRSEAPSLVIVLEALANMDNVGGVFRNAGAFGADAVLLCPRSCDPLYRKAIRVSMGASLRVPFATLEPWPDALSQLRAAGYTLAALHPREDSLPIADFPAKCPSQRVALLLGTEGPGLSPALLEAVDLRLQIPMTPGWDSLNVATAAAIAMHHFFDAVQRGT